MRIDQRIGTGIGGGLAVVAGLFALGSALAREGDTVRAARTRLEGRWVATSVRSISGELRGDDAARYALEFAGGGVIAQGLAGVAESRGTYQVDPDARPGKLDLKLVSGMAVGVYALDGDDLIVNFNPIDLPERLGLLEHGRPDRLEPDEKHLVYTFRKQDR